jgi:hypothetical protein
LSTGSIAMRPVGRATSTPAVARRREVAPIEPEPLEYEDSDTMFASVSFDPVEADVEPPVERPVPRPEPQRARPQPPRRELVREPMAPRREPVAAVREPWRPEPAVAAERVAPSDPWAADVERGTAERAIAQPVWPRSGAPVHAEAAAPRARRTAGEPTAADLRGADLRERPGRHSDDFVAERTAGRAAEHRPAEPPRRRARSADEYLVPEAPAAAARTPGWAESRSGILADAREETRASARTFERFERPEPAAARPERPERRERSAPPPVDEPAVYRARATAPAPPYVPSPVAADEDVIMADMPPEFDLIPPDDTPTLVDLASRRAIRESTDRDAVRDRDAAREAATKSRRAARRKSKIKDKDQVDEEYWGFLRGEAQ